MKRPPTKRDIDAVIRVDDEVLQAILEGMRTGDFRKAATLTLKGMWRQEIEAVRTGRRPSGIDLSFPKKFVGLESFLRKRLGSELAEILIEIIKHSMRARPGNVAGRRGRHVGDRQQSRRAREKRVREWFAEMTVQEWFVHIMAERDPSAAEKRKGMWRPQLTPEHFCASDINCIE
jgi:hypothetical protein